MKYCIKYTTFISTLLIGCTMINNATNHKNKLANESSPYLLQHASNPVNWYPWGDEALKKAQEENKMLLISIGYAACHWCHVMEHESFEDEEVAKVMNDNFINIKVDREERPDVDQVYMNAVQLLTGSGGWPLNCFALPDGSPVYGGTYFNKTSWLKVLEYMADIYKNETHKAVQQAKQLNEGIQQTEFISIKSEKKTYALSTIDDYYKSIASRFDNINGGFGQAPKFPLPVTYLFLLRYHYYSENHQALDHVIMSLEKIANGGIYDHVGGGFARYSVDATWKVPHFEKMLYDNGQLISLYSEAYQLTKNEKFKQVVTETINFVTRELTSPEGAFYSSLDADSEGEEGKFYVWTKQEIENLLKNDAEIFCDYFNIKSTGNWEHGKNILYTSASISKISKKYNITVDQLAKIINEGKEKLLKEREKRIRPGLDDKILTSWNALMIKGLTDAYRVFNNQDYLQKAELAANFIIEKQTLSNLALKRNYKNGKGSIPGFLDDYALMIDALINLYKATFNENWLDQAKAYSGYTLENFYDTTSGMFYYTDKNTHDLVVRKMEITDNVIPSSNSIMANNLYKLGKYFDNSKYIDISNQMLANVSKDIVNYGRYYSNWGILLLNNIQSPVEIAITGKDINNLKTEIEKNYLPEIILAGSAEKSDLPLLKNRAVEHKTLIYVCKNYTCKLPVETIEEALPLIKEYK